MKRAVLWAILALVLVTGAVTARRIYPQQKWWMRTGYVKAFEFLNWLTGNDFPPPDRFK